MEEHDSYLTLPEGMALHSTFLFLFEKLRDKRDSKDGIFELSIIVFIQIVHTLCD